MNAVLERQLLLAFIAQACIISHLLGLVGRPGGGHAGGGLVQAPEIGKKKEEELNRREFQEHLS